MASSATPKTSEVQLFAVTTGGLRALAVPSGAVSVLEVMDELPTGIYSALRTFGHDRFLWLDEHFARTERSMAGLGWSAELDRPLLARALSEAVSAYPLPEARVRFDVLPEPFSLQGTTASLFLALSPFVPVPAELLDEGVCVDFARHLRRPRPRIKTTDFVRERRPLPLATRECYESILLDGEGRILECSSSNITFVRGRELVTAASGVLEGITLGVIASLAPSLGLSVQNERVHADDLDRVDEAFLTSSNRGVVPVVQVGGARIGNGRVGPATRSLLDAYYAFAEREAKPAIAP